MEGVDVFEKARDERNTKIKLRNAYFDLRTMSCEHELVLLVLVGSIAEKLHCSRRRSRIHCQKRALEGGTEHTRHEMRCGDCILFRP